MCGARPNGILNFPAGAEPIGRYVEKGEELALVIEQTELNVRAVVEQADIALIRDHFNHVQIRLPGRLDEVWTARLLREVPAANYLLPSKVLGERGGGRIPIESGDERGLKTTRKVFQVELALPEQAVEAPIGQRVFVRFDHDPEPLVRQVGRRVRQLFLRSFGSSV